MKKKTSPKSFCIMWMSDHYFYLLMHNTHSQVRMYFQYDGLTHVVSVSCVVRLRIMGDENVSFLSLHSLQFDDWLNRRNTCRSNILFSCENYKSFMSVSPLCSHSNMGFYVENPPPPPPFLLVSCVMQIQLDVVYVFLSEWMSEVNLWLYWLQCTGI